MALQDRYINPFTDFGFKKLFGTEVNKELLIDFLNQLLPEKHQITGLTYAQNEHFSRSDDDRRAIFDLYCVGQNGDRFIVEMQKAKQNYFKDRSVYYTTFPIQEQARQGDWNFKLAAVYLIGILDFVFSEDKDEQRVKHVVQLKDEQCRVFYDKLTYIYLEMPNFTKNEDELETRFDKWLYVLKRLPYLQDRPARLQERVFQRLFEAAEIAKFNKADYEQYETSLKVYRDLKNVTDTARDEGLAEGLAEGLERGIQQGRQDATVVIVRAMLASGESVEKISQYTGLSVAGIQAIQSGQA